MITSISVQHRSIDLLRRFDTQDKVNKDSTYTNKETNQYRTTASQPTHLSRAMPNPELVKACKRLNALVIASAPVDPKPLGSWTTTQGGKLASVP